MFNANRRERKGDLSAGSAGFTLTPIGAIGGTPFTVTAAQLGLVTIEEIVEIRIASTVPAVQSVSVVYQLAGSSTAIGGTLTSSAGTTVGLQALVLGI